MNLNIYNWKILKKYFPKFPFFKKKIKEILFKHFSTLNLSKVGEVSNIDTVNIVFVSKEKIKQLNNDFRKKNKVTDVLSFVLETNPLVGEIYICPEYISKEYEYEEVLRNIVHGFLHLVGYDHGKQFKDDLKNSEDMFVKQENILHNILCDINM